MQVNLVSEHIWCNDFLVRSFYLKNVQTQETRTLTQFHFLSWPAQGIPSSTRPLQDFRRYCTHTFIPHLPQTLSPLLLALMFAILFSFSVASSRHHSFYVLICLVLSLPPSVFYLLTYLCISLPPVSLSHSPSLALSVSRSFFLSMCDGAQRSPWYCTAVCVIFVVCS